MKAIFLAKQIWFYLYIIN